MEQKESTELDKQGKSLLFDHFVTPALSFC